ncbi:MAG: hypothetical protein HYY48_03185 [Gammaproteobacteria bacterium]|nr:hypothetical protein [Gammaproteobacteria bacterium]
MELQTLILFALTETAIALSPEPAVLLAMTTARVTACAGRPLALPASSSAMRPGSCFPPPG